MFGRPDAVDADVFFVRDLAERLGVRKNVLGTMARLARRAEGRILALPVGERHKALLSSLLDYSLARRA